MKLTHVLLVDSRIMLLNSILGCANFSLSHLQIDRISIKIKFGSNEFWFRMVDVLPNKMIMQIKLSYKKNNSMRQSLNYFQFD